MIFDSTDCYKVSNDGLKAIAKLPKLEHLDINFLLITDDGLKHLVNIKRISCRGCLAITDKGISALYFYPHLN